QDANGGQNDYRKRQRQRYYPQSSASRLANDQSLVRAQVRQTHYARYQSSSRRKLRRWTVQQTVVTGRCQIVQSAGVAGRIDQSTALQQYAYMVRRRLALVASRQLHGVHAVVPPATASAIDRAVGFSTGLSAHARSCAVSARWRVQSRGLSEYRRSGETVLDQRRIHTSTEYWRHPCFACVRPDRPDRSLNRRSREQRDAYRYGRLLAAVTLGCREDCRETVGP